MAISDLIPWNNRSREMTTQRGSDVHPVLALHREMNRIFDDVFRGFDRTPFGDFRASESLSWPKIDIDYAPGTRTPVHAVLTCTALDGSPVVVDVEPRTHVVLHLGGGYGGDPQWIHGQWKGENFTERVSYDLNDPALAGMIPFGVIDHCARATCDGEVGHGLFEHGTFGRHDPSGFVDWSNDRA